MTKPNKNDIDKLDVDEAQPYKLDPHKVQEKYRQGYRDQWLKDPLLTLQRTLKVCRFNLLGDWLKPFYPSPPEPFMLICRARSGSNYLLTLLDAHPRFRHIWEPFGEHSLAQEDCLPLIREIGPLPYLEQKLQRVSDEQVIGFKVLYHQFRPKYSNIWEIPSLEPVEEALIADTKLKVIHLKRHNILHSFVSNRVALKTRQFIMFSEKRRHTDVRISLTPAECEREFERVSMAQDYYDGILVDHPLLQVSYEALAADPRAEGKRLLDFLGLKQRRLRTYTVKQNARPMHDIVTNFAELKAHFGKTRWASFFD